MLNAIPLVLFPHTKFFGFQRPICLIILEMHCLTSTGWQDSLNFYQSALSPQKAQWRVYFDPWQKLGLLEVVLGESLYVTSLVWFNRFESPFFHFPLKSKVQKWRFFAFFWVFLAISETFHTPGRMIQVSCLRIDGLGLLIRMNLSFVQ